MPIPDTLPSTLPCAESLNEVSEIENADSSAVESVQFSPDGSKIVSGGASGTIKVWDAGTLELKWSKEFAHDGYVYSVVFSPDGKTIVSGSMDKTIKVWEMRPFLNSEWEEVDISAMPKNKYGCLCVGNVEIDHWYTRKNYWRNKVTGSNEKQQPNRGILELKTEKQNAHDCNVLSVVFAPDKRTIVSASGDIHRHGGSNTIKFWDATTLKLKTEKQNAHSSYIWSVALSPDGKTVVSGSADKRIKVWAYPCLPDNFRLYPSSIRTLITFSFMVLLAKGLSSDVVLEILKRTW